MHYVYESFKKEILIKLYDKVQEPSIISSLIEVYCKDKTFDKLNQEFIQKAINEDVKLKNYYANMLERQNVYTRRKNIPKR